jgi:hypothetical protein
VEDEFVENAVGQLIKVVVARLGEAGGGQDEDEGDSWNSHYNDSVIFGSVVFSVRKSVSMLQRLP